MLRLFMMLTGCVFPLLQSYSIFRFGMCTNVKGWWCLCCCVCIDVSKVCTDVYGNGLSLCV